MGAEQQSRDKAGATTPSFDELYARGQAANKNIRTMTARFVETTSSALLLTDRPVVERGLLYVERPSRVALHYTEPAGRMTIIDGKWLTTLWPSRGINQKLDIGASQNRAQKYFVDGDAGELRRVFDIELRDRSTRPGTREVTLIPKRKQIREALSRLDLWIEDERALLKAMRMTFANGDTKLMEFENVVINPAIDPAVFIAPK